MNIRARKRQVAPTHSKPKDTPVELIYNEFVFATASDVSVSKELKPLYTQAPVNFGPSKITGTLTLSHLDAEALAKAGQPFTILVTYKNQQLRLTGVELTNCGMTLDWFDVSTGEDLTFVARKITCSE